MVTNAHKGVTFDKLLFSKLLHIKLATFSHHTVQHSLNIANWNP